MVEMSCEEHDRHAASTQFITHTVGRVLGQMAPKSTPIDTKGYQSLLNLVDNTNNDSFELYYGLFMYNPVSSPGVRAWHDCLRFFRCAHSMAAKLPQPRSE